MRNIIIFGLLLLLCSCQDFFSTTIEIDPPEYTPQMVIHAYFNEGDSILIMRVNESKGLLESIDRNAKFNDANVELFEDGILIQTFDTIPQDISTSLRFNYIAISNGPIIKSGKEYELRVSHPDYPTLTAKERLPANSTINSSQLIVNENTGGGFEAENTVKVNFDNPLGEENYYEIGMVATDTFMMDTFSYEAYSYTTDLNAQVGYDYDKVLLSDENFDGKNYILSVDTYNSGNAGLTMIWKEFSKGLYLYSKSIREHLDSQGFGFFVEPVSVYSNVENGLGIFGLFRTKIFPVEE